MESIISAYRVYCNNIFLPNFLSEGLAVRQRLSSVGKVSSKVFEMIGRELEKDYQNEDSATDGYYTEIKSGLRGQKFLYSYGKDSWYSKIQKERSKSHIHISYSEDYKDIRAFKLSPDKMEAKLNEWEKLLFKNNRKSKDFSIPETFTISNGIEILVIENCELIKPLRLSFKQTLNESLNELQKFLNSL